MNDTKQELHTKTLELVKHCVRTTIDERELMMSRNMGIDLFERHTGQMAIQLSERVYASAWKVQVVEGPVIRVPATWVDMLQLRVKYCSTAWMFFLWPLIWLFFHKRVVQYRETKYPDIEFKARELFPQIAFDGRPNWVIHERPRFMGDFELFDRHALKDGIPKHHEEPAYILCRHCNHETPLKDILRPKDLYEKQAERARYMGPNTNPLSEVLRDYQAVYGKRDDEDEDS